MDWSLLARLIVAHILGDFVLQPDTWVADRNRRHFFSPYLYFHGVVHFMLATSFSFMRDGWWIGAVIAFGHILFDGVKAWLRIHTITSFMTDQLLHLAVILGCWGLYVHYDAAAAVAIVINDPKFWWLACGYLAVIFLYPRLIALATQSWRKDIPAGRELLYRAGRWIGIIERVLVLTFVLLNQFAAVGFLLAAKSVFRFGDLREGPDKVHTEYVMIGTLLSFGLTILTGLLLLRLI